MNPNFDFTENARCLLARYDSGVSNHKGVNSGIFVEGDFPGAVRFIDKTECCESAFYANLCRLRAGDYKALMTLSSIKRRRSDCVTGSSTKWREMRFPYPLSRR